MLICFTWQQKGLLIYIKISMALYFIFRFKKHLADITVTVINFLFWGLVYLDLKA